MRLFTAITFDAPSKDWLSRHMAALKKAGVLVYREIYRKALCGVGTPSGRPQALLP